MPAISMFYGVVIYIYFFDNKKHNKPHIHVKYAGSEVVLGLPDGEIMEGSIPNNKMKLVEAWIEIHKGQFEKFWVLNFGIAAKAHFKKSAILLWRIHRIEWLK